jgi:20S proteasome subunit alpha 5
MARPYGVALLIAGVDKSGAALFHTDPSGTMFQYKAKAIGSAAEGAQTILQEQYHENLTLDGGVRLALSVLKQVMEDKITASNIQISVVGPDRNFSTFSTEQVQAHLAAL